MNIDLDKYMEFIKGQILHARSLEDIDTVMEEAKKFMQICFYFKEENNG